MISLLTSVAGVSSGLDLESACESRLYARGESALQNLLLVSCLSGNWLQEKCEVDMTIEITCAVR
jgi:hypothetical protein